MGQPMLLRGRHGERRAIVPAPLLFRFPIQPIVGSSDIAVIVFCSNGDVEPVLKRGDRRFDQTPFVVQL